MNTQKDLQSGVLVTLFYFGKSNTVAEARRRRVHKNTRIKPHTTDGEPSLDDVEYINNTHLSYQEKKAVTKSKRRLVVELVPVICILAIPFSVQAGVFSALTSFLAKSEQTASSAVYIDIDHSARFTPLLSARTNPAPLAVGGGDITVEDGALVATAPVEAEDIASSPNKTGEIRVYVVREGDSLSQIAEMYGVTANTILWANDLKRASDIRPGQTLVILPIAGVRHTVAKGETLSSIVKKYEADMEEVLSYNELAEDASLVVGDEIIIPGGNLHSTIETKVAAASPKKSTGAKSGGGWLSHPAPGAVKTQGLHGYNAVDLAAAEGTAIRAAADGEVIVAKASGWNGGYGNYVVIKHSNGVQTLYSHLSSVQTVAGEYVSQGEVIGGMGSTGKSTGTHLHFEVRGGTNPF